MRAPPSGLSESFSPLAAKPPAACSRRLPNPEVARREVLAQG